METFHGLYAYLFLCFHAQKQEKVKERERNNTMHEESTTYKIKQGTAKVKPKPGYY